MSGTISLGVSQYPRDGFIVKDETVYFFSTKCGICAIVMADRFDFLAHKLG